MLADKKKQIDNADLIALVTDQTRKAEAVACLKTVQLQYASHGFQGAIVSIQPAAGETNETKTASAIGSGSIQAIYNSIDLIFEQQPVLTQYEIQALTSGEDAQAEVHVALKNPATQQTVYGIGIDFDVLEASAKAYVEASEKFKQIGA